MIKTSRSKIFIDFFPSMLKALVGTIGAGVGEGRVAATPIEIPVEGSGDAAAAVPIGGLIGGGGGTTAPVVVVVMMR